MTKKKKKKSTESKGGRGRRDRSVWRTDGIEVRGGGKGRKERRTCETRRREDPPSALSAVNGVHVADDLSQALRLFALRRDRSTARHLRGSLVVSSKDHVGPSKIDAVQLSRAISSRDNERCLSSFAIFSLKNPLSPSVDRSHRERFLNHPMMYHSLLPVFHPD